MKIEDISFENIYNSIQSVYIKAIAMKKLLLFFISIGITLNVGAQSMNTKKWRKTENDSLVTAQSMFEQGSYQLALPIFVKLLQNHPNEAYLKYVTGISGLSQSNMHEKSLEYLEEIYKKNKKIPDIELDLARAYNYNYKFDESIAMLDAFKKKKPKEDKLKLADKLIDNNNYGKELYAKPANAKLSMLDKKINTPFSEFYPIVSSDESFMIFTYSGDKSVGGTQNGALQADPLGDYYEDVFYSTNKNGTWTEPAAFDGLINTNAMEVGIGLSNDAQTMFVFKDDGLTGGDIFWCKKSGNTWSAPEKLKGEINTYYWESNVSLSANGRTLYFSSARTGGFGGKDIYKATLQADSSWGNIQNLGLNINTTGDEDAPFIHPDGRTLIFSSNGYRTMGGTDLFVSYLNLNDSTWSTPKNLGYPINTPSDDFSLVVNAKGTKGYLSSSKPNGIGQEDIYVVDMPNDFEKPIVATIKGKITFEGKPVAAQILISDTKTGNVIEKIYSNSNDGYYLMNLPKGIDYLVTYKYRDNADQTKNVNAKNITAFDEFNFDIAFVKEPEMTLKEFAAAKNDVAANAKEKKAEQKLIETKAKPVKNNPSDEEVAKRVSSASSEGVVFKIQIGAYKIPRNFKADKVEDLGKIERIKIDGGITCITVGSFTNLNDAVKFKQRVIKEGFNDAFIIANYNGTRKYVYELEKMGLLK